MEMEKKDLNSKLNEEMIYRHVFHVTTRKGFIYL